MHYHAIAVLLAVCGAEINFSALKVGDGGTITVAALQKIDGGAERFFTFQTLQVLDENSVLMKVRTTTTPPGGGDLVSQSVVLFKMSTDRLVDDQELDELPGFWIVSGKHKYTTADGTQKTVFVVSKEPEKDTAARAAARAAENAERERLFAEAEWQKHFSLSKRQWLAKSGKLLVEGIYDGFEPGHVWLKRKDKQRVRVPLSQLSEPDRRHAVTLARIKGHLKTD